MNIRKVRKGSAGFSLLELVVSVAVILVLSAIAIPEGMVTLRAYRLAGSARSVAHELSLARLRAETDFTNAQVVIDTTVVPNTYKVQVWDKTIPGFVDEGGTQFLSQSISFGFGAATAPAGGQAALQQTVQTVFNSRGIPIDGAGAVNPNDVIYLADDQGNTYAVSVTVGGHTRVWRYNGGGWDQQ